LQSTKDAPLGRVVKDHVWFLRRAKYLAWNHCDEATTTLTVAGGEGTVER